jgi:hypothetical protein
MANSEQIVRLPLESLPPDVIERQKLLSAYFPDKRSDSCEDNESWLVRLRWPYNEELEKDPEISAGLFDLFGSSPPEIIGAATPFRRGCLALCLNDSWTLLDWSRALKNVEPKSIVVIHVDAHSDLMSPLLESWGEYGLRDLLTGKDFSLSSPSSVASAIESGAVGIGSFVVPFLWQANCEMLVHVCHTEYAPEVRGWGKLIKETRASPPFPSASRPVVRRSTSGGGEGIPHLVTERISNHEIDLRGKEVLVHVDLDYFNNRIDGDSHWHENPAKHDPSLNSMMSSLETLFDDLLECGLEHCVAATVACSPEFCPAERWAFLVDALENRFAKFFPK